MANYATLKAAIQQVVKTNGNNEITGALLQQSLLAMINSLGAYYQFVDVATPSTNPGTPDQNVMYFAATAGIYSNFGGIVLNDGEACFLCYNGSWSKKKSGAATEERVKELGNKIDGGEIQTIITSQFNFVNNGGFYIDQSLGVNFTGELLYDSGGDYAPAVDVSQYDKITVVDGGSTGNRAVILTNASNRVVYSGKWGDHTSDHTMIINVSELGGKYLYISKGVGISCVVTASKYVVGVVEKMDAIEPLINEINEEINGSESPLAITETAGKMYLSDASLINNANSYYADVDLSEYDGKTIEISMSNIGQQSGRYIGLAVNGVFVASFAEKDYNGPVSWVIPGGAHLYMSHVNTSTFSAKIITLGFDARLDNAGEKIVYVSKTGNDGNDGTAGNPYLTIQKAINANASRIMVGGGVYDEILDLGSFGRKRIEILKSELFKETIIQSTPTTIATTGETLVSGYTNVYKLTGISTIPSGVSMIVQIGKNFGAISGIERRPEQRGKQYRLNDTPIKRVRGNITTVSAACDEIQRAISEDGVYLFYVNGTDLYFARPGSLSSSYPLVYAESKKTLFKNVPNDMTFVISGIHTRFLVFNIERSQNSIISDCISEFAYGSGAFSYDGSTNIIFRRCEAAACSDGLTGDGFNGHVDNITGYSDGQPFAKCCTCTLEYCWSHDNKDDGYSDHQRAETMIIGGLYEYNGKGGVVPSYGSHCVCIDVESRHNCNGFFCCGKPDSTEGGIGTQLKCYNCVATENTNQYGQNYNNGNAEQNAGFYSVNDACLIIAYNCISCRNKVGYNAAQEGQDGGRLVLYDCKAFDNTQVDWQPKSVPNLTTIINGNGLSY